jgi:hypothetical protein
MNLDETPPEDDPGEARLKVDEEWETHQLHPCMHCRASCASLQFIDRKGILVDNRQRRYSYIVVRAN